jgi:uncharacterized membrane-anchored protein
MPPRSTTPGDEGHAGSLAPRRTPSARGRLREVDIVGWAQPPRYDAASKRIYWARELDFEGGQSHTLNYDIRVLGREGYLSMNAVADMRDMAMVKEGMQRVLPMAQFDAGHAYADYKPAPTSSPATAWRRWSAAASPPRPAVRQARHHAAAAKKFVIAGVVALGALAKKIFGGKDKKSGTVS